MKTLLLDLRDRIWELNNKANVRIKKEFQSTKLDNKVGEMPETMRVLLQMKEYLVLMMRKKCAYCSFFISFVLFLVLGMFIGKFLSSLK